MFRFIGSLFCFLVGESIARDATWARHEVYSGARVNSAVAHDYNGDGKQEIIFSAGGEILVLSGDDYETKGTLPKFLPGMH